MKEKDGGEVRALVTRFLSELVENDEADMKDRLKASELLSKAAPQADAAVPAAIEVRVIYGAEA